MELRPGLSLDDAFLAAFAGAHGIHRLALYGSALRDDFGPGSDCDTLTMFLGSRSQRVFEWPLATDGRRHVHTRVDTAGLPVRHQTRRQGRPYTLVLTKTDELVTRAGRAAPGRERPGVAEVDACRHVGVTTPRPAIRLGSCADRWSRSAPARLRG